MPGYNVAAINGFGFNPYNNYFNQAALTGLYDDCYSPMGMNNGLLGFAPSFTGMNYDSYFQNMMDYQNFTSRYQLQTVQNQRNNELQINAPMEAIQGTANVLNEKIVANEQEQIMDAWGSYVTAVRNAYPNADDATLLARAKTHYQQIYGTSLNDDIRKYGNGSFTHGLYKILSFGLYQNKSAEQNIADLTGQKVGKTESLKETIGMMTGGAAIAGTGIAAVKGAKYLTKIPKFGWLCAAVVTAGATLAAVFGKSSN